MYDSLTCVRWTLRLNKVRDRCTTYSLSLDTGETSSSALAGHSLHTRGSLTTGGTASTGLSL